MTLDVSAFLDRVDVAYRENPAWRYGQAFFNTLYREDPDLANQLSFDRTADPFYDDTRVGRAVAWLYERR